MNNEFRIDLIDCLVELEEEVSLTTTGDNVKIIFAIIYAPPAYLVKTWQNE